MNIVVDYKDFKICASKGAVYGDRFFNNSPLGNFVFSEDYYKAQIYGLELLILLKKNDPQSYKNIHKGTPYYWLGMASYMMHDFISAMYFFDAAVSEDLNNKHGENLHLSPSILFATLNDQIPGQAAKTLVTSTVQRINEFLDIYNSPGLKQEKINIEDIREFLLQPAISKINHPWRTLTTSIISFFLEWDYRQILINIREQEGSRESFFIHLFKGCLIFESLLKANTKKIIPNNSKYQKLGQLLMFLKEELGLSNQNCKIGRTTFSKIILELEDLQDDISKYVEITGKVRNTLGHNLIWNVELEASDYQQLFSCIALSLIHAINHLFTNINIE